MAAILGVMVWLKPGPQTAAAAPVAAAQPASADAVPYSQVAKVFSQHCVVCHSSTGLAQKNVKLDVAGEVAQHTQQIYQQVVVLKKMPFGNPDSLNAQERELVKRWFESGASTAP